jgi:hypothetical protein
MELILRRFGKDPATANMARRGSAGLPATARRVLVEWWRSL